MRVGSRLSSEERAYRNPAANLGIGRMPRRRGIRPLFVAAARAESARSRVIDGRRCCLLSGGCAGAPVRHPGRGSRACGYRGCRHSRVGPPVNLSYRDHRRSRWTYWSQARHAVKANSAGTGDTEPRRSYSCDSGVRMWEPAPAVHAVEGELSVDDGAHPTEGSTPARPAEPAAAPASAAVTRGTLVWFGVGIVLLSFFAAFLGSWLARSVDTAEPAPTPSASATPASGVRGRARRDPPGRFGRAGGLRSAGSGQGV